MPGSRYFSRGEEDDREGECVLPVRFLTARAMNAQIWLNSYGCFQVFIFAYGKAVKNLLE